MLKASLEGEGGSIPEHDTLALPRLECPELPPIPERVFKEHQREVDEKLGLPGD